MAHRRPPPASRGHPRRDHRGDDPPHRARRRRRRHPPRGGPRGRRVALLDDLPLRLARRDRLRGAAARRRRSRSSASRATPRRWPTAIPTSPRSPARWRRGWPSRCRATTCCACAPATTCSSRRRRRPELRAIHVAWGQAVHDLAERVLRAAGSPRPHTDAIILVQRDRRAAPGRGDRAAAGLRAPRAPGDRAPAVDPHGAVTPAALRRACLAMTGATEEFPFGPQNSVFKVCGQDLRHQPPGPLAAAAHLAEVRAGARRAAAREPSGDHARLPPQQAPLEHVVLDGSLPDAMVRDMIEDSYDLIVAALPKARQRALGWTAG